LYDAATSGVASKYVSLSNVTGYCPTGQCSWSPYTTLAICSSFEDVSSALTNGTVDTSMNTLNPILPELGTGPRDVTFWTGYRLYESSDLGDTDNANTTFPVLANVYVIYFPLLVNASDPNVQNYLDQKMNLSAWKAFKGSFSACLQTIETNFGNSSVNTSIIELHKDLTWQSQGDSNYWTQLPQSSDNFTLSKFSSALMAASISTIFSGNASLYVGGDNYYNGEWIISLVNDIMGDAPSNIAVQPDEGFQGFSRRIENIATSFTN
jgi:hypothetical protein